jgi:hypothetical protein
MALPELVANTFAAITTVATKLELGSTTLKVEAAAPAALQATGQFRIVIGTEVLLVTAGASTTTWTVARAREGSTEATHAVGANIEHELTAEALRILASVRTPYAISGTTTAEWGAIYFCTASSNFKLKLPTAVGNEGKSIVAIVVSGTKVVTVEPNGSEKINGVSTMALSLEPAQENSAVVIHSDGTNTQVGASVGLTKADTEAVTNEIALQREGEVWNSGTKLGTGVCYVTLNGNDANSGATWGKAKRHIQNAINALPEGPELLEELENRPCHVGTVEVGWGVFKEETKGEERHGIYQPKAGGKSEEYFDPNCKAEDVGKFVYSLSQPKNFFSNEMPIIASVNTGTHIVKVVGAGTGKGNIWGGKTPTEGGSTTTTGTGTLSKTTPFSVAVTQTKEFKASGGTFQLLNEAGEAISCSYEKKSVTEGAGSIEGCLVLREGNATKWASSAKIYYEVNPIYHTCVVFKPAVESSPGVHLKGRGKHSGPGLKASTDHGTCVEDIGKHGWSQVVLSGLGEKAGSFVGYEMTGIVWQGSGTKANSTAPKNSQAFGEPEGGEVIGGFFTSSMAEIAIRDCQFQGYQQVGCAIGAKSVVTLHCEYCFFTANGVYTTEWMSGINIPSAGLWLAKAPNQGVLLNNRYNFNFGVGVLVEGGIGFFNDEHSHNLQQANTVAPFSGVGLYYTGGTGFGNLTGVYGWGEGNDCYEMYVQGNGLFTLMNYTFRGASSKNSTSEPTLCPTPLQTGSGRSNIIACEFTGQSYWPEKAAAPFTTTTKIVTLSKTTPFVVEVAQTKEFKAGGGLFQVTNEGGEQIWCSYEKKSVTEGAGKIEGCLVVGGGKEPVFLIGVGDGSTVANGKKVYPGNNEAAQEKWLVEPGSGQLLMTACIVAKGSYEVTKENEKGIKGGGPVTAAIKRSQIDGKIELPSQLITNPEVAPFESALSSGVEWQNIAEGADANVYVAIGTTEAACSVKVEVGEAKGVLSLLWAELKGYFPTTGTTPLPVIQMPYGHWMKITVTKGKIIGPGGAENKVLVRPR